jgi:rod shape-determining protein MreC
MATNLRRRSRPRFTVLVMVLASITVLTLDAKNVPVLGTIRSGMLQALSPIESGFSTATHPLRNAWNGVANYDELKKRNQKLQAEVDRLKGAGAKNADLQTTVDKLKKQLGVKFVANYKVTVAQIATGNFSSFDDDTAQINQGTNAGIAVGNPVIDSAGLVGKIIRTSSDRSVMQLITDPDLEIGVRLQSNDIGVGQGEGAGKGFIVNQQIELTDKVTKGELVSTCGCARATFPGDIPIGTVSKITRSQSEQTQILNVKLDADLTQLDYVQVLHWLPRSS